MAPFYHCKGRKGRILLLLSMPSYHKTEYIPGVPTNFGKEFNEKSQNFMQYQFDENFDKKSKC